MRSKAAVIVAVVMGLLALIINSTYLSTRESELLELSDLQNVYVATVDIQPNTILDESLLQLVQVPATYVQPTALGTLDAIVGRVTVVPIPRGMQIVGMSLEQTGRMALSQEVPRGRRAVTISVSNATGVGGLVEPGNYVDILGTFEFGRPVSNQGGVIQYADERTETRVLLQDVLVLAVNQTHRGTRPPATLANPEQPDADENVIATPDSVENVTLLVDPPQVQELILAQQIGFLTLALRSDFDEGETENLDTLDPLGLLDVDIPIKPRRRDPWQEIRGVSNLPF